MRTNTAIPGQNPIARDFQNVVDDAHELLKTVQSEGEASLGQAKSKVAGTIEAAASKLAGTVDAAKSKLVDYQACATEAGKKYAAQTDDYVRSNPWQAVGIGAAFGALLGLLIARR
jgi:ElaB protein